MDLRLRAVLSVPIHPEQLKWLRARDLLWGRNYQKQDIRTAIRIAEQCTWPEAKWMTEMDPNDAHTRLLSLMITSPLYNSDDLMPYADAGDSLAQAEMARFYIERQSNYSNIYYATLSALQDDPEGWYWLATMFYYDDISNMKVCAQRAADLGYINAYEHLALYYSPEEPEYYIYKERYAIVSRDYHSICNSITDFLKRQALPNRTIYQIGLSFNVHLDCAHFLFFGNSMIQCNFKSMNFCVQAFFLWRDKTRLAVDAWTIIARRLANKDIRRMIGEYVWASRKEGLYEINTRV